MPDLDSIHRLSAAEVNLRIIALLAADLTDDHLQTALERLLRGDAMPLRDEVAAALHVRLPKLLAGPYRRCISAGWPALYPQLIERAIAAGDEPLVDFLAGSMVTRAAYHWRWSSQDMELAERLSRYYEALRDDDAAFARRAINVLSQAPAHSVGSYRQLVRTNRLARLFYEHPAMKLLAFPDALAQLLAAAEVHVRAAAFRAMGLDDDAARRLAAEHLDALLAAATCPLPARVRTLAWRAAENGAATSAEAAQRVQQGCRQALRLPKYPREQVLGVLGRLLHRWPQLRVPTEQPTVYAGVGSQNG